MTNQPIKLILSNVSNDQLARLETEGSLLTSQGYIQSIEHFMCRVATELKSQVYTDVHFHSNDEKVEYATTVTAVKLRSDKEYEVKAKRLIKHIKT